MSGLQHSYKAAFLHWRTPAALCWRILYGHIEEQRLLHGRLEKLALLVSCSFEAQQVLLQLAIGSTRLEYLSGINQNQ